ncbi:MAG: hypothetical protein ABFC98_07245 [Candidatus Cloacimonas sp.]
MLRRILSTLIFCLMFGFLLAQADSLYLPQFASPYYDSFSRNYNGTTAAGRGYTGAAILGSAENALLNPASVIPDSALVYLEMNVKPSLEAVGYPMYANYVSSAPLGMFVLSAKMGDKLSWALLYNNPKSITLKDFSFYTNQGQSILQRFPTYNLHQATAMLSYHNGPLHLGLNLHNQIHYIDDPIFLRTYERINDYQYNWRIQPGIIYQLGSTNIGFSMMPASNFDWDLKYAVYEAVLPMWMTAGVQFGKPDLRFAFDAEWEQCSDISDSFDDRYTFKAGLEKKKDNLIYRLGYHYASNVYSGNIYLAKNYALPDTSNAWDSVPETVYIDDNAQHSLTAGLSYYHKYGVLNLAIMQVISGKVTKTQLNLSLSLYLKYIFSKKELYLYD